MAREDIEVLDDLFSNISPAQKARNTQQLDNLFLDLAPDSFRLELEKSREAFIRQRSREELLRGVQLGDVAEILSSEFGMTFETIRPIVADEESNRIEDKRKEAGFISRTITGFRQPISEAIREVGLIAERGLVPPLGRAIQGIAEGIEPTREQKELIAQTGFAEIPQEILAGIALAPSVGGLTGRALGPLSRFAPRAGRFLVPAGQATAIETAITRGEDPGRIATAGALGGAFPLLGRPLGALAKRIGPKIPGVRRFFPGAELPTAAVPEAPITPEEIFTGIRFKPSTSTTIMSPIEKSSRRRLAKLEKFISRVTPEQMRTTRYQNAVNELDTLGKRVRTTEFLRSARATIIPVENRPRNLSTTSNPSKVHLNDEAIIKQEIPDLPTQTVPRDQLRENFDRLQTGDDVIDFMADLEARNLEAVSIRARGKISLEETRKAADQLGISEEDILKFRRGKALNAEEGLAFRQANIASSERALELAKRASDTGAPEDILLARASIEKAAAIQQNVLGAKAEVGRALSAFRIPASGEPARSKIFKRIFGEIGGQELNEEMIEQFARLDFSNIVEVNKFLLNFKKAKTSDKLFEVWINGLLSGPSTHIVNTTSNTFTALTRPIEATIAPTFDFFRATFKGVPRERFFLESVADMYGMFKGMREGVTKGLQAFITETPSQAALKIEAPRFQAIKGVLGRFIRIPGRLLLAEDEFFKSVNYHGKLHSLAYRKAAQEGKRGKDLVKRVSGIIQNPFDELVDIAKAEALYRTFTKPLGKGGRLLTELRDNFLVLRPIIPFLRTPINITKFGLERTPLNYLRIAWKVSRGEIPAAQVSDELAKATMGTMIGAGIISYVNEGLITGGGPRNFNKRRALFASGWRPYSFKIGDQYISYSRFEPLAIVLGLSADYVELYRDIEEEDAVSKIGTAISQNILNKTFMRGLSDAFKAMNDPDRHGGKWLKLFSGSLVPFTSLVGAGARAIDPTLRRAETPFQAIVAKIPGASVNIPALRNIWGEPVISQETQIERFLSPVRRGIESKDPATLEVVRLDIRIGTPRRQLEVGEDKVKLEQDEYEQFLERSGARAKGRINSLISTPAYKRMGDEMQRELIEREIRKARSFERKFVKRDVILRTTERR